MTTMTFDNKCFKKLHKTESWMYTNVSTLAKTDFALSTTFVDEATIHGFDIAPANSFVVLINGVFSEINNCRHGLKLPFKLCLGEIKAS